MHIASYIRLPQLQRPFTGVSRHAACMLGHLRMTDDVTVVASRADLTDSQAIPADNGLAGFPVTPLPLSHRLAERCWHAFGMPAIDRWVPTADWVYSPVEVFVPTRRAKSAVTVHDLHALEPNLPWSQTPAHRDFAARWRRKFGPLVRHTDLFLAVSEFTKTRLHELLGVSPDRISVVGNGVDDMFFTPAAGTDPRVHEVHGGRPYVLLTGGLTRKKGGHDVLPIATRLAQRAPDVRLIVVGFKNDPDLERDARQIGNFVWAGHVDDRLYHGLLGNARALLFLSRYEGFGIPPLEAMAMGVPVVASRSSSIPEVVGDAATLVDAESTDQVVDLLCGMSQSHEPWQAQIARGRARAAASGWDSCAVRLRTAFLARN